MDRVCLGSATRVPEFLLPSQISEVPKPPSIAGFRPQQSAIALTLRMRMREIRKPNTLQGATLLRAGVPPVADLARRGRAACLRVSQYNSWNVKEFFRLRPMTKTPRSVILVPISRSAMTHEELEKLRERLVQASQQQHPRSRLQKILDRILQRVESMVDSEEKQPEAVAQSDHSG